MCTSPLPISPRSDHYDNLERNNRLTPLHNVAIGDFGVAKFEGDDRWYRARLLACEEDNRLRIVYIDFGNIEVKSMNDFFPLEQAFAQLPAQAIACSLSDVRNDESMGSCAHDRVALL